MKNFSFKLTPLLAALVLVGCAAPEFHAPQIETPSSFKEEAAGEGRWKSAQPAEAQQRGEWWKVFNVNDLNKLIDEATAANPDLAAAAAREAGARHRRHCGSRPQPAGDCHRQWSARASVPGGGGLAGRIARRAR